MPLIDEQSRATDRRPPNRSLLVAVGLALVFGWGLLTLAITLGARRERANGRGPAATLQAVQAANLQQAEQMSRWGDFAGASRVVQSVDTQYLSFMEKHTYLRVGGEALAKSGSPLAAAGYYDRFLSMGAGIRRAECRECHAAPSPGIPPTSLDGMTESSLGAKYAAALVSAGKLPATRDSLRKQWKKKPEDPRLNILLYHLEKTAGDKKAAEKHAAKLRALDQAQAAGAGSG